ncbi:DUF3638 domain-containing protein [Parachlamydia sp. AcF125]|uniref:DUF3638 domain-containing protein n=1 Tax=Parachlamydia sp. AcF125 TaxID=2795736 RepID=UPI001BC98C32|nr:DUF3638 domain-containing protein [Parachlamydia sp. AcF125]MBS4168845.1 hypothetical protein [Parachlamydia sp. AcF125]
MVFSIYNSTSNGSVFFPNSFSPRLKEELEQNPPLIEKQLSQEKIEELSWLAKAAGAPRSDTFQILLFANESGDPFIKNSSLEGLTNIATLTRFIDCMKRAGFNKSNLADLELFENCLPWARGIQDLLSDREKFPDKISKLAEELVQHVSHMKEGENLLLPGGWINCLEGGHTLFYLIQKNKNSYSLAVYNTGKGLEYHEGIIERGVRRADVKLKAEKIHSRQICQHEFFQALIELQTLPFFDRSLNFSAQSIYAGLLAYLKGKRTASSISNTPELMRKPQHSGSCTMEALFGVLRSKFLDRAKTYREKMGALEAYRKVKFAYRKQSLVDACLYFFDPQTPWTRTSHKLISEVSSKLARDALKMRADNLLTEAECEACAYTQMDIKQRLAEKKRQHFSFRPSALLSYDLPEPQILVRANFTHPAASGKLVPSSSLYEGGGDVSLPPIPFEKIADITPQNVLEALIKGKEEIEAFASASKNPYQVVESVSRFLYALPLPYNLEGRNFWNGVPEGQITQCLELLFGISAKYCLESELFLPRMIIGSHISLVIGEYLARRQPDNFLQGYTLDSSAFIAFAQSPHFTFEDPSDQQKLQEVLQALAPSDVDIMQTVSLKKLKKINKNSIFSLSSRWGELTIDKREVNPETQYYLNWMYTSSVSKELEARGLDTYEKRLAAFFEEQTGGRKLLPASVLYLRQLSYFATGLLQFPMNMRGEVVFKMDTVSPLTTKDVMAFSLKNAAENLTVRLCIPLFLPLQKEEDYLLELFFRYRFFNSLPLGVEEDIYWPQLSLINHDVKNNFKTHFYGLKQNVLMQKTADEEIRDAYITSAVLQDEVVRILAYYQGRPEALLEDGIEQEKLTRHLLRPRALLMQLYNEPTIALKLLAFINTRLAFFQAYGKKDPFLFFCRLGNICNRYIQFSQKKHPERFISIQEELEKARIDYRKKAIVSLLPKCKNGEEVYAVCQTLKNMHVGSDVSSLKEENLLEVAQDYFGAEIYAAFTLISKKMPASVYFESKQFYASILPKIQNLLNVKTTFRNAVLNAILNLVKGTSSELRWKGIYPHFNSGKFEIDLASHHIYESGEVLSHLPRKIAEEPLFTKIFPEIPKIQEIARGGRYIVVDKNGESTISLDEGGNLSIERIIGGISYMAVPEMPPPIKNAISYDLFHNHPIIWFSNEFENSHYLIQPLGTPPENQRNFKIYYKLPIPSFSNRGLSPIASSFYQLAITDEMQLPPARILLNPWNERGFDPLKEFENEKYIACWADIQEPTYVKEIEMTRLGLHFDVVREGNGKQKAFCREVPGYYLEEDQKIEFGASWPKYLVVKNNFGQKKILMPNNFFEAYERMGFPFDVVLHPRPVKTAKVLIYDYKEIEGEPRLKPTSVEDALYLVCLSFTQKSYKKALYYLKKSYSLGALTKYEQEIVSEVIAQFLAAGHPSAVVVGLKAFLLFQENKLKYIALKSQNPEEVWSKDSWERVAGKYVDYIQNIHNTTRARLTLEEERSLLRFFCLKKLHLISPQIAKRVEILSEQKSSIKKLSYKSYTSSCENEMVAECVSPERFFDLFTAEESREFPTYLMGLEAQEFRKLFSLFYRCARHGSKQEKEPLGRILELFKGSRFYIETLKIPQKGQFEIGALLILHAVLKHPRKFPSLLEIQEINHISSVVQRQKMRDKVFRSRILKNIRTSSFVGRFFKQASEKVAAFYLYGDLVADSAAAENLLFQILHEAEKKAHIPFSLHAQLELLDRTDDLFFDQLLQKYMGVEDKQVATPIELPEIEDNDPLSQAYFNQLKKGIKQFYELGPKTSHFYHFQSAADLSMLQEELKTGIEKSKGNLAILEKQILSLMNTPAEFENVLKQAGKLIPALSLSEAIELFEKGDLEFYKQRTHLSGSQIGVFEKLVTQYLVVSTRSEQALRALNYVKLLQKLPENADEKNPLIQKIGEELSNRRHYSEASQNCLARTLLLFEHRNKVLLRKKQVSFLEKILSHPYPRQLITQLGTGAGKSKVLASLLEWLSHKQSRLVFNLWPSALYPVNKNDMKLQVGETFNQVSDTYEFERSASTELYHLIFARRELGKARLEKSQLNARPESLQCTELKFLEKLYQASLRATNPAKGEISVLQNILKAFLTSEAHFDEEHVTLSAKKEVNFTIGDPVTEPLKNILLLEELFRFIVSEPEIVQKMNVKKNLQYLVSEEMIKQEIAPRIAQHMGEYLKIAPHLQAEFGEYVLGKLPLIPQWILSHPRKQEIGLLKGELTALLPSMLSNKIVNVHYGLSHLANGSEYAKPYEASDSPIENADYDNIHEILNKTYLTYLNQRLSTEKLWKLVKQLQFSALAESKIRLIDVSKTESYRFFEKHFPPAIKDLFLLEEGDMEGWKNEINQNDEVIFHYVKLFVSPSIKKYALKLRSDSQNLRSQVGSLIAMSATPGNPSIYGLSTRYEKDLGSDERVLDVLSRKCADPSTLDTLVGQTSAEILECMLEKILPGKTNFRMLIDIGALFKGGGSDAGGGNLEIAKKLLGHFNKNNPEIRGIVFFHEDQLKILERGRDSILPLEQSQLMPHQRFTFCDHKHMFGADVKQFSKAEGIATFSKHTTKDDLLQGAGRLRELLEEQTVKWVTTQEIYQAVAKPGETFTFEKLLSLAIKNQAEQEADDLYRSIKQQMRNDIRAVLMRKLIHAKSEKDAIALFKDFFPFLVEKVELDAFKLYGGILKNRTDAEELLLYRDQLLIQLGKLKRLRKSEKKAIHQQLLTYDLAIKERESQLSAQKKQHFVEIGVEAEIQQNVEKQVEVNLETFSMDASGLQLHKADKWRESLSLYKDNWIKPSSTLLLRIMAAVRRVLLFSFRLITSLVTGPSPKSGREPSPYLLFVSSFVSGIVLPYILLFTAGVIFVDRGLNLMGRIVYWRSGCLLFSAHSVIQKAADRKISAAHPFFKNSPQAKLLLTNNFVTLRPKKISTLPIQPLGKEQKPLYEVLVVEDEFPNGKKQFSVIMGDQSTDGVFWRKKLVEDREKTPIEVAQKRKRKICLYDLHMGIVQNGKNGFDEQELKNNPDFQKLIVKAKLYNADSNFNDKEEAVLARLLSNDKTRKKMRAFFERALIWHHAKQSHFYQSIVHTLLNREVDSFI